jgi:small subunit ribosomal protein S2
MLVDKTEYLTAGVHIGMKSCTPSMSQFIYKIRDDGLAVFNLKKVDERIKVAADFLAGYRNMLVVSRKDAAAKAVAKFAESVGGRGIPGRFSPGTLTNPTYRGFYEPDVVLVVDPVVDDQVIGEAKKKRIPVVALCDTFNTTKDVDLAIPVNNNGKKAIALVFWIMAREILKNRGDIKKDADFKESVADFEGPGPEQRGGPRHERGARDGARRMQRTGRPGGDRKPAKGGGAA